MRLDPDRAAFAGGLVFVGFATVAAVFAFGRDGCAAYAYEVPPLIRPMPRSARDVRDSRPTYPGFPDNWRHASPVDGPMCIEPLELGDDMPERVEVEQVISACGTLRGPVGKGADPFMVLDLLRLERDLGAPPNLLVATYCVEAAMQAEGRHDGRFLGDWRDGSPRALGPFQLHENVWAGTCHGTPDAPHDLLWAGACYMAEVLRVEVKARRVSGCDESDMLRVAEAAAANVRRYGWRCDSKSKHWRMMEVMR